MRTKAFWTIFIVIIIALGIYFVFVDVPIKNDSSTPVDIENDFGSKVVYTSEVDVDTGVLEADCELRGGEFNECGSVCEPGTDICTTQCAYTCEGIPEVDSDSTSTVTSTEGEVEDKTSTSSATSTNQ